MIPVFVPSYQRPDAIFLKRSLLYEFPLYVFVREEEAKDYAWLKKRPDTHLIKLKKVFNIGETRQKMLNYARSKGIDRIFMIDDDVGRLDFSVWDEEKQFVRASGTIMGKPQNWTDVLLYWEMLWGDEAMFGASYRPFSWSMKKSELGSCPRAQLQQAVGINVKAIMDAELNYQSNSHVGNEDLFLQLECYTRGLECLKTTEIQYDCSAMGTGKGGCNASERGTIQEKQHRRVRKFLQHCKYLGLIKVAMTRSGIESIKFNWKEIQEFMEELE